MRRLLTILVLLLLPAAACYAFEGGDTGTYRILDYRVNITPSDDGSATIEYYQKWQVTAGHIPWITVGTPDSDYAIESYGANAAGAGSADSGDWTGIRLDLDRDYQPGATFEVKCTITDQQLVCAYDNDCGFEFTPGWYDRAAIDALQITFVSPVEAGVVTTDPMPTSSSNDALTWQWQDLSPGSTGTISVHLPKNAVPNATAPQSGSEESPSGFWVFFVIAACLYGFAMWVLWRNRKNLRYTGGKITRGGGGYYGGGYHCACACACAGCACACACAGGGGAGCSRKLRHSCPACKREHDA